MKEKSFFKFISTISFSFIFLLLFTLNVFAASKTETATFSGGCFWAMESMFQKLKGVISVDPGYAGGTVKNPSYEEVCTGNTGHAETIQIIFDPSKISYETLLNVFWHVHNPTTLNRQGEDEGTQYRSVIFYHDKKQKELAEKTKAELAKSKYWGDSPIVTQIEVFTNFYKAEDYHKDYYNKHPNEPYSQFVVAPKIAKFKKEFKSLLK